MTCNSHFSTFQFMHEWVLSYVNFALLLHVLQQISDRQVQYWTKSPYFDTSPNSTTGRKFRIFQKDQEKNGVKILFSNLQSIERSAIFYTYPTKKRLEGLQNFSNSIHKVTFSFLFSFLFDIQMNISTSTSVCPFVCFHPSVCVCIPKLASILAVVSQNITNKNFFVCVKIEKYAFGVTLRPHGSMRRGKTELCIFKSGANIP